MSIDALLRAGRLAEAEKQLRKAMKRSPRDAALHATLGRVLWKRGALADAAASLQRAAASKPQDADIQHSLGCVHFELQQPAEALAAFVAATRADPRRVDSWLGVSQVLLTVGRANDARAALSQVRKLEPERIVHLWALLRAVPIVCDDAAQAAQVHREVTAGLQKLAALCGTPAGAQRLRGETAAVLDNFHLHYLQDDQLPLQRAHGALVHAAMVVNHPELASPPDVPASGRVRVAVASSCLRAHTVARLFRGLLSALPRTEFELAMFQLGKRDAMGESIAAELEHAHFLPHDAPTAARAIRDFAPHVLLFPELGMDVELLKLAALRSAPVQATLWGHPITTGLPTVDYVLSSALMEPEGGDAHYTERVERLPGTGLFLAPTPQHVPGCDRAALGLPDDRVLLLSCQSLFKYRPAHDALFARVAARAPDATFVFLRHPSGHVTAQLQARLQRAFAAAGVAMDGRVLLLPRLTHAQYLDLNALCDVFVDSVGWSGGQSTLEALTGGLPVVTLPGATMRSRHTAAFLTQMGMPELIADSEDAFVERVATLASDPEARAAARSRIADNRAKLFEDHAVVDALVACLRRWAAQ